MRLVTAILLVAVSTCDVWAKTAGAPLPTGKGVVRALPPIPAVPLAPALPTPATLLPPPIVPPLPPIPRY